PLVQQLSEGDFDVTSIIGQVGDKMYVTRTDMNHAPDVYPFDLEEKSFTQLTEENKEIYSKLKMPTIQGRSVMLVDGNDMLPYAQGGPQSPLSQCYSYRWNFQVMASQGYIIVAPNRRGMPGHGVQWNLDISKNWGDLPMQDYLSAIDDVAQESYVDTERLGA